MSEENKQLVRRWFEEVWNKGRVDAIDEMLDENGIAHGLSDDPSTPIIGPAGFKPFHTVFRDAFPNMMIVVEDAVAEGDKVAARVRLEAVHADDGRDVEMDGLVMVRIDGGRIVEEWASWDYLGLAEQLGVELSVNPPA